MIRKLTETDRTNVLNYLYQDSSYNIFIIGDIEAFGFDKKWQTLYGEFNEVNEYISTLLFYREHAIFYSHLDYFNQEYLNIFKNHNFEYMSGRDTLMDLITPFLLDFKIQPMLFCRAQTIENTISLSSFTVQTVKTEEDCSKLYDLLVVIDEFGIKKQNRNKYIEGKMNSIQMGVTLFIEENGKVVSTVATTAETTKSAMVVAVATLPEYRKKGYASVLMISLMKEYFENRHKELCLFYDNPKAGKIYKRLGFKDIGKWVMTSREN
jgi:predicted GNAT family acetyltransferase